MKKPIFVAGLIFAAMLMPAVSKSSQTFSPTTAQYRVFISDARSSISRFRSTRDIDVLRSAIDNLSHVSVDYNNPNNDFDNRRWLVSAYAQLFVALDHELDPSFSPDDRRTWPSMHVDPPPGYPPGTRPSDVSEPDLRAQFEAALKTNNEKLDRQNFQVTLRRLDDLAMINLRVSSTNFRATTSTDTSYLRELLIRSGLTPKRVEQIASVL